MVLLGRKPHSAVLAELLILKPAIAHLLSMQTVIDAKFVNTVYISK